MLTFDYTIDVITQPVMPSAMVTTGAVCKMVIILLTGNLLTGNIIPPEPHLYIVNSGFTVVYITFLNNAENIDYMYSYTVVLTSTNNLCIEQAKESISIFDLKIVRKKSVFSRIYRSM